MRPTWFTLCSRVCLKAASLPSCSFSGCYSCIVWLSRTTSFRLERSSSICLRSSSAEPSTSGSFGWESTCTANTLRTPSSRTLLLFKHLITMAGCRPSECCSWPCIWSTSWWYSTAPPRWSRTWRRPTGTPWGLPSLRCRLHLWSCTRMDRPRSAWTLLYSPVCWLYSICTFSSLLSCTVPTQK